MTAQALPKAYHICRPLGVALHPQALVYFHPDYKNLQHPRFRVLLAHALLTLGKVPFGQEPEAAAEAQADHSYCMLDRFTAYCNEKHQCGYCKQKSYFFCSTCFPDESQAKSTGFATRQPRTGRASTSTFQESRLPTRCSTSSA